MWKIHDTYELYMDDNSQLVTVLLILNASITVTNVNLILNEICTKYLPTYGLKSGIS